MGAIASQITSRTIVYSTVYSDADQGKHQYSTSLAFVRGIRRGPANSPHKWPVTRKMFPFDDVIMKWPSMQHVHYNPRMVRIARILLYCGTWGIFYWTIQSEIRTRMINHIIFICDIMTYICHNYDLHMPQSLILLISADFIHISQTVIYLPHDDVIKWKHFPRYWPFVRGIHRYRWIPHTKASDAELWCFLSSASE